MGKWGRDVNWDLMTVLCPPHPSRLTPCHLPLKGKALLLPHLGFPLRRDALRKHASGMFLAKAGSNL